MMVIEFLLSTRMCEYLLLKWRERGELALVCLLLLPHFTSFSYYFICSFVSRCLQIASFTSSTIFVRRYDRSNVLVGQINLSGIIFCQAKGWVMAWQEEKMLGNTSLQDKRGNGCLSLSQTTPLTQHVCIPLSLLLNPRNYWCLFAPALCWSESCFVLDHSIISTVWETWESRKQNCKKNGWSNKGRSESNVRLKKRVNKKKVS